jgi:hypothetical protein
MLTEKWRKNDKNYLTDSKESLKIDFSQGGKGTFEKPFCNFEAKRRTMSKYWL